MPHIKEQTEDRPIIFSGWSIRRILAGKKTQTRRIVRPQPPSDVRSVMWDGMGGDWIGTVGSRNDPIRWNEKYPYGQRGDILWVREAFRLHTANEDESPSKVIERHGQSTPRQYIADDTILPSGVSGMLDWGRKRPSIFMPHELCRLRLRVEDVRVERLQAITEADATAEGIPETLDVDALDFEVAKHAVEDLERRVTPRLAFKALWQSIHGPDNWEDNPFVWCVSFSVINN